MKRVLRERVLIILQQTPNLMHMLMGRNKCISLSSIRGNGVTRFPFHA